MDWIHHILETDLNIGKFAIGVPQLLLALLIILLSRFTYWSFRRVMERSKLSERLPLGSGRFKALLQIFRYALYAFTTLLVLNTIGFQLTLLTASTAAIFVGVGLTLQKTFQDVVSGVIILFDGTIEVGDVIEINTLDLFGKVIEIRLRNSVIETPDSMSVLVPNSNFLSTNVINWNYNDKETRFWVEVGVAYGADVEKVQELMITAALANPNILATPTPSVRFTDFGNSALVFQLLFWTRNAFEIYEIKSELRYAIEAAFREHKVKIPYPQRDLHIISDLRPTEKQ